MKTQFVEEQLQAPDLEISALNYILQIAFVSGIPEGTFRW